MGIANSECVFVALVIQLAMRMRHIIIRRLSGSTVSWCFSDRASWIVYTLITNLMHRLLFIH